MLKNLFLIQIIVALFTINLQAQTINNIPVSEIKADYVEIRGSAIHLSSKLNIEIDFGQKIEELSGPQRLYKDKDGNRVIFESMIDALNFMSEGGYKLIDTYALTLEKHLPQTHRQYHYILRKENLK